MTLLQGNLLVLVKSRNPWSGRRRATDVDMAPACVLRPEYHDYWRQLSIRKRQFAVFKTQHADVLASLKANVALPADVEEQRRAPTPLQKQRAMLAEREPWLHVYGLSQDGKDSPDAWHQEYLYEPLKIGAIFFLGSVHRQA